MTQTKAELLQTRHQGDIRLGDADSTHYVGFKAPSTVSSSLVWTLPAADGTANYLLKTDGSGNLGWVADSSTDSTKMPLAGGTFTGDVVFTGDAANVTWDKSADDLIFNDNAKAVFGTDSDGFSLYHDGSHSYIKDDGTGDFNVISNTIQFSNAANDEFLARFVQDGGVELYYDSVKHFETHSLGIKVIGDEGGIAQIDIQPDQADDNADKWKIGATDNGNFFISNKDSGAWDTNISCNRSGNVELYYNAGKKFETTSAGSKFTGSIAQVATAMAALDLDLSTSNYFTKTISGNSTFTFSNPASSGEVTAFTLELTHTSGTVAWPSEVKWNANTEPTLTTGKTHLFMFVTDDGGSRYRGSALVDYVN